MLEACKENGVTLVAYSPLCQGLLTGARLHCCSAAPLLPLCCPLQTLQGLCVCTAVLPLLA